MKNIGNIYKTKKIGNNQTLAKTMKQIKLSKYPVLLPVKIYKFTGKSSQDFINLQNFEQILFNIH